MASSANLELFDSEFIQDFPKINITAIADYNQNLIIGDSQGHIQAYKKENSKSKEPVASSYCKLLKEKFGAQDKYDENYAEDGTTILKHNNFKILLNIEYDKVLKQFKFGKISEELKEMFLSFGIKKKDLERDADFAFTLFKKVIVGLGNENKLKNSTLDSIEHVFPPPEEREKLRKAEELAEAKMNSIKNKKRTQQKRKEPSNTKKVSSKPQTSQTTKASQVTQAASKPTPTVSATSGNKGVPSPPPPPEKRQNTTSDSSSSLPAPCAGRRTSPQPAGRRCS